MNCNNKIGLSRKHWFDSTVYIFPSDVFMIEGMNRFSNFDIIHNYALDRMEQYQGSEINLYVSGGLSSEVLEALRATAKLDIICNLYHFDTKTWKYSEPQKITWKPQAKKTGETISLCSCANRHELLTGMPSIFEEIPEEKLFDFSWMEENAYKELSLYAVQYGKIQLQIYLTGLTQAYTSILNAAGRLGMPVTMKIYDFSKENYVDLDMDR